MMRYELLQKPGPALLGEKKDGLGDGAVISGANG